MAKNWSILYFKVFDEFYKSLAFDVHTLKQKDSVGYKSHTKTKLLKRVHDKIWNDLTIDPTDSVYNQGNTLGKKYRAWKRVKGGLPDRYRMLFKFSSKDESVIIAWLNDEFTLRKEGAHSDIYRTFIRMLCSGQIPNDWPTLKRGAVYKKDTSKKIG